MDRQAQNRLRVILTEALSLLGSAENEAREVPSVGEYAAPLKTGLAWGAKVSAVFRERVRWIASELVLDPNHLMACMAFESGRTFKSNVKNPRSSATGLIQFMRSTAIGLGTTVEDLALMTPEDQLNFVYKYFQPYKGRLRTLEDVYMAILWPKAIGQPSNYQMFVKGNDNYTVNAGLDINKDHIVTKAECAAKVSALLAEGFQQGNVV